MSSLTNKCLEFREEAKPLVLSERTVKEPPPRGLIIKVAFCGVCHSDVDLWEKPVSTSGHSFQLPMILGHEVSGHVHSIGSDNVEGAADLTLGTPVVLLAWGGCRKCPICQTGNQNCRDRYGSGVDQYGVWIDGGYQQYISVQDRRLVLPIPETVPMATAAVLTCGGVTAYNAICNARDTITMNINTFGMTRVLVIGAGGLGLWAIKLLKAMYPARQLKVTVADVNDDCLVLAKDAGADATVLWARNADSAHAAEQVKQSLEGGIDAVLDFVNTSTTMERAFHSCNFSATIVLVGLMTGTMPPLPLPAIAVKNIRIQGIYVGSLAQLEELMQLVADKKVGTPPQTEITLEDVNQTFQDLIAGKVKGRSVIKMAF